MQEKSQNNIQKTFEKPQKNAEKIFKKTAKHSQASVLPFYVLDVLVTYSIQQKGYVTAKEIATEIHERIGISYSTDQIRSIINNMHVYSQTISVTAKQVRAGRSRANGFIIQFKYD